MPILVEGRFRFCCSRSRLLPRWRIPILGYASRGDWSGSFRGAILESCATMSVAYFVILTHPSAARDCRVYTKLQILRTLRRHARSSFTQAMRAGGVPTNLNEARAGGTWHWPGSLPAVGRVAACPPVEGRRPPSILVRCDSSPWRRRSPGLPVDRFLSGIVVFTATPLGTKKGRTKLLLRPPDV
jgi:hypothetical protein